MKGNCSVIASVCVKDGYLYIYNEPGSISSLGGVVYELGKPLLDFVWYEHDRFIDSFSTIVSGLDHEFAHLAVMEPDFKAILKEEMSKMQQREIYVYFYYCILQTFIDKFVESANDAILYAAKLVPGVIDKLSWVMDFEWPEPPPGKAFFDKEKRLYRAASDIVELMYEDFCRFQEFVTFEIEILLHYRNEIEIPKEKSIEYLSVLDEYHTFKGLGNIYLEYPYRMFYGRTPTEEVAQLCEINCIEDLFKFEFIKMIENNVFIKKCKNCERYFITRKRADTEYCDRTFGDTHRKCSEIGAMLRYEKKVAENPILDAHKKAYRRFNSRVRNKKMTQIEFLEWSEEAILKRDACVTGKLPFDEFIEWLEQGRLRKRRSKPVETEKSGE